MGVADAATLAAALATPLALRALHPAPWRLASPWTGVHALAAVGARAAATRAGTPPAARAAAVAAYAALAALTTAAWPPPSPLAAATVAAVGAATVAAFESAAPGSPLLLLPLVAWACFSAALATAAARRGPASAAKWAGASAAVAEATANGHAANGGGPCPPTDAGDASTPAPRRAAPLPLAPGRRASADHDLPPLPGPSSASMLPGSYGDAGAAGFRVRGGTYAVDRVKYAPAATRGRLARVELVATAAPVAHIAAALPSYVATDAPFSFVWHVLVPGKPACVSLVCVWAFDEHPVDRVAAALAAARARGDADVPALADLLAPPPGTPGDDGDGSAAVAAAVERSAASETAAATGASSAFAPAPSHRRAATAVGPDATALAAAASAAAATAASFPGLDPFDVALARFVAAGGDAPGHQPRGAAARHAAFKVVPRIDVGPWVVKSAVGQNTPVLLGRKVDTKEYAGAFAPGCRYIEVDVDVGSSRTAARVVGLVQGALRSLDITIAVLLEGRCAGELPEALLGTVHLSRVDLSRAPKVD